MKKKRPLISVVMPNLDGQKYLDASIKSFLLQDYKKKALIIVDARSIDKSHQIIQKYSSKYEEIFWIKEVDKGLSDAINIGISKSDGDIIGYLGSDDILYPKIFSEIVSSYQLVDFDAVYFDSISYWPSTKRVALRKCPKISFTKKNLLKYKTIVGLQDIYFKRAIFDKYKFDNNNKYSMDYELYLRIAKENYLYHYVEKIATINIQDKNITTLMSRAQNEEVLRVAKKYCSSLADLRIVCKDNIGKEAIKRFLKLK